MEKHTIRCDLRETVGLDLSDRWVQQCHISEDGEIVQEGKFRLTRAALEKEFGELQRTRFVIETGGQSSWVRDLLEELGHEVIVGDARKLQSISGDEGKCDRRDARQLARLGRIDPELLQPVKLRSREQQTELVVIRARAALVDARIKLVNTARALAKVFGFRFPACRTERFAERAIASIPSALQSGFTPLVAQIQSLTVGIEEYDEQIVTWNSTHQDDARWLSQVAGVGPLTTMTFMLTLQNPERFRHSRDVGPFLGLTPRRKQSGEQDPHLPITKCGDRYLRMLLLQCAHHIIGPLGSESALRSWALSRMGNSRGVKKRIVVAVARKLAVLLHRLWKRREVYRAFPLATAA